MSIENQTFNGDISVNRDIATGGNVNVRGCVKVGHNLRVMGYLDAPNLRGAERGLFPTEEALRQAWPNPKPGWWALVGNVLPAPIYVVANGQWVATGKTGGQPSAELVDLNVRMDAEERATISMQADIEALQERDNELGAAIESNSANITSVRAYVEAVDARAANAEAVAAEADKTATEANTTSEIALSKATYAESVADAANTKANDALSMAGDALSATENVRVALVDTDAKVAENARVIAGHSDAITDLETRVQANTDRIAAVDDTLTDTREALSSTTEHLGDELDSLKERHNDFEAVTDGNVRRMDAAIAAVDADLTEAREVLSRSIDRLDGEVENVNSQLDTLAGKVDKNAKTILENWGYFEQLDDRVVDLEELLGDRISRLEGAFNEHKADAKNRFNNIGLQVEANTRAIEDLRNGALGDIDLTDFVPTATDEEIEILINPKVEKPSNKQ